ncbi:DUF4255 domain-containing protein [Bradyrhizobium iriomotense]|uniref:Pvc16 N-terminal domain-containing protein n=1 Tax=Bradyrhizobium iriomotense TaxID=441950 RepID=A0ABQ6B0W9_9BRAD|nr:DUF4255 domain-containing protein [Bradyrhizobium iriomotense]GLR87950.1 hypothetical protein GCM10007857_46620 [Bradyrhizobium iriomotense]
MPLVDSQGAIGAVSGLLQEQISARLSSMAVSVGRPEEAAKSNGPRLNLFLYRIGFDASLRNLPLDPGQQPPIWLVLYYLLTAFDGQKESDSTDAHTLFGRGILALQELNFLRPTTKELAQNPESLKITFDEADVELLSKLMQGSDEKYRVSAAFQIRPVMIMGDQPSSYAPLVKTVGPPLPNPPPYDQTGVWVLPNLGPRLETIVPARTTLPVTLTLDGNDLGEVDQVQVGPLTLAASPAPGGDVTATISAAATLSAGAYPVIVSRPFASHTISSNVLLLHVLPELATATPSGLTAVSASDPRLFGHLSLTGTRLGGPGDSIFIAFFGDGDSATMFEAPGTATQDALDIDVPIAKALDPGTYRIILRVNGEQADDAIAVNWS